jgi:hypothetical protein
MRRHADASWSTIRLLYSAFEASGELPSVRQTRRVREPCYCKIIEPVGTDIYCSSSLAFDVGRAHRFGIVLQEHEASRVSFARH